MEYMLCEALRVVFKDGAKPDEWDRLHYLSWVVAELYLDLPGATSPRFMLDALQLHDDLVTSLGVRS